MNLTHLLTKLNPFKKKEKPPLAEVVEEIMEEVKEVKPKEKKEPWKNYKIAETDKQLLVSLYATGLTPTEVADRARTEYNIDIVPETISQYARADKWQPLIRKVREAHMNDLAAVSGSHKRVRLERHEKVYEKALKKNDLRNALAATESQRKEMEGDSHINMTLNQFNTLSDEELEFKKKQVMDRIKLIDKQGDKK